MGGACSKQGAARENVLGAEHLQHNLLRDQTKELEDVYEIVEVIGEGSISRISKVKKREVGGTARLSVVQRRTEEKSDGDASYQSKSEFPDVYFALKEIDLSFVNKVYLDEMVNEIELLKSLDHPNIIKAYETFKRKKRMAIVMEMCTGGDLHARKPYSERLSADIVQQILSALAYLHDRNIIHRDLKYENIMFGSKTTEDIKLIDFGLAKKCMYTGDIHHERVGTIHTMAPEVTASKYSGSSSDMWSVGVLAFMLLSDETPFWGNTPTQTVEAIRKAKVNFEGVSWENISTEAKDFVLSLLKKDPKERLTAKAALKHPFIVKRRRLSTNVPDPQLADSIDKNLRRYVDSSDFNKIALLAIANRMSSEEIVELRKVFSEFDTSCEGTISKEEFSIALFKHGKHTEDEIESLFSGIDVNKTDTILYTEFLAATLEAQGNIAQHKIAECFDELDEDDTGYISRENLRRILPKTMPRKKIDELIAAIDSEDMDGKISFEEFRRAFVDENQSKIGGLYAATSEAS